MLRKSSKICVDSPRFSTILYETSTILHETSTILHETSTIPILFLFSS